MRLVDRRIVLLLAVFLVALAAGAFRAAWLGTVRAADLRERAHKQQVDDLTVSARRGTITDRTGIELAVAEDAATVFANPFLIKDPAGVARRVAPLLERPAPDVERELADRRRGFAYLRRKLDAGRGEQVERLGIEGIDTVLEPRRRYPRGSLAAQLLGAVGTDNTGLWGLEQLAERRLHGSDGRRRVVKDALGKPVSLVEIERARPGHDLRLTIDTAIQERVEAVLSELATTHGPKGATALVMDPRTAEILALANWPPVDPERPGTAGDYARQDRAVSGSYEPGSTFKAFTVSGALEERLVTPETPLAVPPTIQVADRTIEEAHAGGGGTLSVADILAQSSNVGAVMIGLELGKERFDHWVRRFGFGAPTGVELPGEAAGIVPAPRDYWGSSMGNLPIGQGLAVTPMQMASAYAAIANGGTLRRPQIVAGPPAPGRRIMSEPNATRVRQMLEGVLGPGGTAEEASVPGYRLAGKTGTAEKPDGLGGYSKTRFVASFIGFAPARNPRLLVAVMVDEPSGEIYGGAVAAPAFQKIISFALPYLRIPPDG